MRKARLLAIIPALALAFAVEVPEAAHEGKEVKPGDLPGKIELVKGREGARLLGHPVKSQQGQVLGELADFGIESGSNRVFAVISLGGVLGEGARRVAVPFDALELGHKGYVVYKGESAELKARPRFRQQ